MVNEKSVIFHDVRFCKNDDLRPPETPKIAFLKRFRCADAHCGSPAHGAKQSPPSIGPFGGSYGQMAKWPQMTSKMTPLDDTSSMRATWITKSPLGETRVTTWASFHCGFDSIDGVYPWSPAGSRIWCEALSSGDQWGARLAKWGSSRIQSRTPLYQVFSCQMMTK